jgi:hypothetical protein
MATPGDIIQGLIKLGTVVKGAAAKVGTGTEDWSAVLGEIISDSTVSKSVSDLFNQLKGQSSIDTALAGIREKEAGILKTANAVDASGLSGKALLDYHALADAELALATQKVIVALTANFLDWIVDDALPVLTKVLPIILAAV